MNEKFKNRTVIITGGSNGIGEGIAKVFGKLSANICIADIDVERGDNVVNQIKERKGQAYFYNTDVRNEEDIIKLISQVHGQLGKIDILIKCRCF